MPFAYQERVTEPTRTATDQSSPEHLTLQALRETGEARDTREATRRVLEKWEANSHRSVAFHRHPLPHLHTIGVENTAIVNSSFASVKYMLIWLFLIWAFVAVTFGAIGFATHPRDAIHDVDEAVSCPQGGGNGDAIAFTRVSGRVGFKFIVVSVMAVRLVGYFVARGTDVYLFFVDAPQRRGESVLLGILFFVTVAQLVALVLLPESTLASASFNIIRLAHFSIMFISLMGVSAINIALVPEERVIANGWEVVAAVMMIVITQCTIEVIELGGQWAAHQDILSPTLVVLLGQSLSLA